MTDQERGHWEKYRAHWIDHALTLRHKLEQSKDGRDLEELKFEVEAVEFKIAFASDHLKDVALEVD